jgi:hypothetical protein
MEVRYFASNPLHWKLEHVLDLLHEMTATEAVMDKFCENYSRAAEIWGETSGWKYVRICHSPCLYSDSLSGPH